jgi:phosphate transport system protein
MNTHTSKEFESELRTLRERLLVMGGRAEQQVVLALRALVERDRSLAEAVLRQDDQIDRDEIEIDQLALTMLAVRQPVASDLRFITMALKIVTDLERIGDLGANIAKRAIELSRHESLDPAVDFEPLARLVMHNLAEALESFVTKDADRAQRVIENDREVDRINAQMFEDLIRRVASDPSAAAKVIPLTSIARSLERIGDHVKNLAEEVVFMVRGSDVRHRGR